MTPELAQKLLKMSRAGKAVGYSGKAYRGVRVGNPLHLIDQLNIPGLKVRSVMDYRRSAAFGTQIPIGDIDRLVRLQLRKAWDSKKWVEIKLPRGNITLNTAGRGAASFTTDWKQAEKFADATVGGVGDKFEVIFQSSGDKFVDVVKTLKKTGLGIDEVFAAEKEVLAVGKSIVEKIFVRRVV